MPHPFTIPGAPAELMDIINRRRSRIPVGLMMMADSESGAESAPEPTPEGFKSEASKESVLADLAKERTARKELEARFSAVAEAFGVKPEKGAKGDEAVTQLTAAMDDMKRELAVERLARRHGITDEDDLESLRAVASEDARTKLAARLAPAEGDRSEAGDDMEQKPQAYPRPKPDATQGPKGEAPKSDPKPGLPRLTEAVTAALESKN